eukprot:scaffold11361_cov32-Tisochrysis_lutea.AAC.5
MDGNNRPPTTRNTSRESTRECKSTPEKTGATIYRTTTKEGILFDLHSTFPRRRQDNKSHEGECKATCILIRRLT